MHHAGDGEGYGATADYDEAGGGGGQAWHHATLPGRPTTGQLVRNTTRVSSDLVTMLGARSVEEWAEFRGVMPHLTTFTACWSVLRHHSALHCVVYRWERLRHFVTRDSCPWAYCYKLQDTESDHHCAQVGRAGHILSFCCAIQRGVLVGFVSGLVQPRPGLGRQTCQDCGRFRLLLRRGVSDRVPPPRLEPFLLDCRHDHRRQPDFPQWQTGGSTSVLQ